MGGMGVGDGFLLLLVGGGSFLGAYLVATLVIDFLFSGTPRGGLTGKLLLHGVTPQVRLTTQRNNRMTFNNHAIGTGFVAEPPTPIERIATALEALSAELIGRAAPTDRSGEACISKYDYGFTVPARVRDGDNCRWCGTAVQWRGPRNNKSAEYIHVHQDKTAGLAVACRACAGTAGQKETYSRPPLRAPESPYYGRYTRQFFDSAGVAGLTNFRRRSGPNVDLLPFGCFPD